MCPAIMLKASGVKARPRQFKYRPAAERVSGCGYALRIDFSGKGGVVIIFIIARRRSCGRRQSSFASCGRLLNVVVPG